MRKTLSIQKRHPTAVLGVEADLALLINRAMPRMMARECILRLFSCAAFLVQRPLDVLYSSTKRLYPSFTVRSLSLYI